MPKKIKCIQYLNQMRIADGGIVRFLLNYCRDLAELGHEVTLLTHDRTDVPPDWNDVHPSKPRVVQTSLPRWAWLMPSSIRSPELEKLFADADILHVQNFWDVDNLVLVRLSQRWGVPYIVSTHGMLNDWAIRSKRFRKSAYMRCFGKRLLANAARIHCASEGEQRQATQWLPKNKTCVVPLSFDRMTYDQLPGPEIVQSHIPACSQGTSKVLVLGRLHPVKRVELVVRAIAELRNQGMRILLFLAGPAQNSKYVIQLRQEVAKLGLADVVFFLGTIDGEEKVSLYQACDLLVLPSWQENFGMVLAESLAAQTPIITTRAIDTWREFQAAGGRIVEPTVEGFSTAIREMLGDPPLLQELGQQGRQFVLEWLDPDRVLDGFTSMYMDVMARRASVPVR